MYLQEWFPGAFLASSRWALVGLGVATFDDRCWSRVRLQISGLEAIAGHPVRSVEWPTDDVAHHQRFAAELDAEGYSSHVGGVTVDCGFDWNLSVGDFYHFSVRTAAVVTLEAETPLSVDAWRREWITPLVLAGLATGRREQLLGTTMARAHVAEGRDPTWVTGQLFDSGIHQKPGAAEPRRHANGRPLRPLFTLADSPPLATLLSCAARELEQGTALSLYWLASNQELPTSVRFLRLVEVLESLHSATHADEESRQDEEHRARREAAIEALGQADLDDKTSRFIKENLTKAPRRSLAKRIRALLEHVPGGAQREARWKETTTELDEELQARGKSPSDLAARLADARNVLSHGGALPEPALRPAVPVVEALARCELLRRLGFSGDQVAAAYDVIADK